MNKTLIIIQREFVNRVSKKSFILLTLLMPFVFAGLIFVPLLLSTIQSGEQKQVAVIDHTGKYARLFKSDESYRFVPVPAMRKEFKSDTTAFTAVVEIKGDLLEHPEAATIYSRKEVPKGLSRLVSNTLDEQIRHDKLVKYNIPQLTKIMADFDKSYDIRTVKWSDDGTEQASSADLAIAAGMVLTFLIYMFVMSYGGMVMQSVMEEKTNRIVELMVSSVRPFQLMIGKIIGIGLVGIVQLAIWGILIAVIMSVSGLAVGLSNPEMVAAGMTATPPADTSDLSAILMTLSGLNLPMLGLMFVLNFVGGYLLYAAIFAAIGASVNQSEDSQQFMTPIVIVMVFALYAAIYSANNPDGPLAVWCSFIPFTSPTVSMVRLPLGAPVWQTVLSLVVLYASALTLIWMAGKIYRVGILMYGKKPSFSEMIKWMRYK